MADNHPKIIRVAMLGCGVVGTGVLKLLAKHRDDLLLNGFDIRVTQIAVRSMDKPRDVDLSGIAVSDDPLAVASSPDIDMLVEVMGGDQDALTAACDALSRGVPVVTANKAALARCLPRYLEAAKAGNSRVAFEAAAAAHIPIVETLDQSLALEEITTVKGVINGSTNYILTYMERAGCEYEEALADASEKGFTEADPTLDVEGIDAAEKLSLLAWKAFGRYVPSPEIRTVGITGVTQTDIELAEVLGHRVKLVAMARRTEDGLCLHVHPALVLKGELLADVDSEFNAIILEGPSFKALTFLGKGAGELPTGSAVVNDMLKILRSDQSALPGLRRAGGADLPLVKAEDLRFGYFLRVKIEAGQEFKILAGLNEDGVSVLKHASQGENIGIITDVLAEKTMLAVVKKLSGAVGVKEPPRLIRLDKDNYRDIVEQEQRVYFGPGLER